MRRRRPNSGSRSLLLALAWILLALTAACETTEEPACPVGEVQDIDTGDCVPEHCGTEAWGLIERTSETVHVAPWGDDDWDGSERWPYRTIQQGADEAGDAGGGLVAVAAGTYVENLELDGDHDGVEIEGRCAELVVVDGSGEEAPGVQVAGGVVALRGVTVTGGRPGLLAQRPGFGPVEVDLEEVVLVRNETLGLGVIGPAATGRIIGSEISDTQPTEEGGFGVGIQVSGGATMSAEYLQVVGNHYHGLIVTDPGTNVDLVDATVGGTRPPSDGSDSRGIEVHGGATLRARSLLLDGNLDSGIFALETGTRVDLEDTTVRDTRPSSDGTGGIGIHVEEGASLVARGLLLEGNHDVGLAAAHANTTVDLRDGTIRDTQPRPDGTGGRGVSVQEGASLVAHGLLLEENHGIGLHTSGAGTTVDLEDALVSGTGGAVDGANGFGINVQEDASVTALDLQVEDSEGPGVYVVAGGTLEAWEASLLRNGFAAAVVFGGHLALHGGTVSGSTFHSSEGGGVGVFGWDNWGLPDIELDGVAFSDLPGPALYLRGPGRYMMRGCDVQDTGTWPLPGGVLALEGVQPWHEVGNTGYFTGLLLEGNTFSDLPSDAILLDSSSATLDLHPDTGASNTFGDLDGVPLVWQRCDGVQPPEILDSSVADPSCEPVPRGLGPLLEYRLRLAEVDPVE